MSQPGVTASGGPGCPRCGAPAVWHAQAHAWGCDHCRQMLPAPVPVPVPVPASAAAPPPCPRCGSAGVWHAPLGRWGCDHCRAMHDHLASPQGIAEAQRAMRRSQAGRQIGLGLLLLVIGGVITAATYDHASSSGGGTYIVAWGPMVFGAISFFKGLFNLAA